MQLLYEDKEDFKEHVSLYSGAVQTAGCENQLPCDWAESSKFWWASLLCLTESERHPSPSTAGERYKCLTWLSAHLIVLPQNCRWEEWYKTSTEKISLSDVTSWLTP